MSAKHNGGQVLQLDHVRGQNSRLGAQLEILSTTPLRLRTASKSLTPIDSSIRRARAPSVFGCKRTFHSPAN